MTATSRTLLRPMLRPLLGLLLGMSWCAPGLAQYSISQVPMLVAGAPPANIVLTIDDSGSMTWAYVPDFIGQLYGQSAAYAASSYNAAYYNSNTIYQTPPDAGGQPVPQTQGYALTSFAAAYYDGFNPDQGLTNLATSYTPTLSYQPGGGLPQSATGNVGPAYYNVYVGGAGCSPPDPTQAPPPDACFQQVIVSATSGPGNSDERQNFANWYSFYRTRHLALVSAAAQAMQDPSLANVRIAWQALNSCADSFTGTNCIGWRGTRFNDRISRFTGQHKRDFYNWLFQIPAANSTPTRVAWWRAGEYFRNASLGPNGPYGVDPNQSPTVPGNDLLCVENFNITLTDGLWNTGSENGQTNFCGGLQCGNVDAAATTFPDGTSYVPSTVAASTTIYGDGVGGGDSAIDEGGLADIAFYYWSTNLRPDLTGFFVPPYITDTSTSNAATGATNDPTWQYWNPSNDPATWPHMVNFTVGVGLTGFLSLPGLVWSGNAHLGAAYNNLLTAAPNCVSPTICTWPPVDPNASGGGFGGAGNLAGNGNVYDLWHAAINSRGNAFSASSPQDLVNAMGAIIQRIEGQTRGNTAAAGSSAALTATTALYVASYDGSDWHGTVTAYLLDPNGNVITPPVWQTTASSIPAFSSGNRAVFTASSGLPAGGLPIAGSPGIAFSPSSLGTNGLLGYFGANGATLNSGCAGVLQTVQTAVVNYLLGDACNEQRRGGNFRNRPVTVLGDIVDSNPLFSWDENFGYAVLPEGSGPNGYANFLAFKASPGRLQMVYAGANDGMLHGFDATSGNEVFAYVPHSVIPNLSALDNPSYLHSFYVDGPVFVGDAYFAAGASPAAWHSVLVGTTGAGGPGVFALDVTNPQSFGASNVLWDMDGSAAPFGNGDPNLGYTIGRPIIARLNNGDWAAVFGNGYLSGRGCAVLYIVRLSDGLVRTIDTSGASPGTAAPCSGANANNGLGSPTLLDLDMNGTTDFVYAGDLLGHLWKFDLSSPNPANWAVAYTSASMTPAPLFTATTSAGVPQPIITPPNLGPSIGSVNGYLVYFVTGRLFANGDAANLTTQSVYAIQDQGSPITATLRSTLVPQQVAAAADGSGNENIQTPYAVVDLTVKDGWYVDFPGSGERALSEPFLIGNMLLFSTVIPNPQPCNGGCGGFIYALNAFNGDGGLNFLVDTANNTAYDALATMIGCVKGLTLISQHSTLNVYASGNGGGGGGSGTTGSGGTGTGTGTGVGTGGGGTVNNSNIWHLQGGLPIPGRISWHESVQ